MQTVEAVMKEAHYAEVQEAQDTDEHVCNVIEWCIAQIELCGRTLPSPTPNMHRYSELVECLRDAASDGMPAPREFGDDPFMC